MGKARKRRYRERFLSYFLTCCCGNRPADEDENVYEKNSKDLSIGTDSRDDRAILLQDEDKSGSESEICFEECSSSEGSIYSERERGNSITPSTSSEVWIEEQETSPKRPDSFKEDLKSPIWSREEDAPEIFKRLAEQSQKLDKILEKLQNTENVSSLRRQLDVLQSSLSGSVLKSSQQAALETSSSSQKEPSLFTYPTTSESREATEHNEARGSEQHRRPNSEESLAISETSRMSMLPSLSREPKEHDSSIVPPTEYNDSAEPQSAELAETIRDQFEALKKCSDEHLKNCSKQASEALEMVDQMEAQVANLPVACQTASIGKFSVISQKKPQEKNSSYVHLRDNNGILRTSSFLRCSYPSPDLENIELNDLSTNGDGSSTMNVRILGINEM